jgi:branched-chain amino acid transport system substrate-binding protein
VAIGFDAPLSRPGDVGQGQQMQRGAELGVEYVNARMGGALGRPVRLALHDDGGQPDVAVAGYRRLATQERVPIVIGYYHSSTVLGVAEVAKEIGVPIIVTAASAAAITEARNPLVFRTLSSDAAKAKMLASFMLKQGFKNVVLLADNSDYGTGLAERLKSETAGQSALKLSVQVFDPKAADLTPQLLRIKASKPDLVLDGGIGPAAHLILDQATTIGLVPDAAFMFSDTTPTTPTYWQLHPGNGVGPYYVLFYSPNVPLSPAGQWLVEQFRARFNETPTYAAINSFGNVLIAAQAITKAASLDPKAVTQALASGEFHSWATSPARFPKAEGVNFQQWNTPLSVARMTQKDQRWFESPVVYTTPDAK